MVMKTLTWRAVKRAYTLYQLESDKWTVRQTMTELIDMADPKTTAQQEKFLHGVRLLEQIQEQDKRNGYDIRFKAKIQRVGKELQDGRRGRQGPKGNGEDSPGTEGSKGASRGSDPEGARGS